VDRGAVVADRHRGQPADQHCAGIDFLAGADALDRAPAGCRGDRDFLSYAVDGAPDDRVHGHAAFRLPALYALNNMEPWHLESAFSATMFIGLRVSSLFLFAPFLSSASIPMQVKAGLAIAITALLYPVYRPGPVETGTLGWVGVVSGEVLIGLLLGLTVQLVVEGAQMAGQVLGVQAGYSLVTLLDPQTQADLPVMSTFNQLLALLIFLQLDVHHGLLRGLAASFAYLPPGAGLSKLTTGVALLRAAGGIWLAGVQLAAPVLVATLLVDITLGFLSKASPQMPVLFVGLSFKTLLSLTVFAGTLVFWPRIFERQFAAGISLGERLLHLSH
jgi:flagellar biosynthetic protein FliR